MPPPLERTRAKVSRNRRFSAATKTRIFSAGVLPASARAGFTARRRESGAEPPERAVSLAIVSVIETPPLVSRRIRHAGYLKAVLIYNVARRLPNRAVLEGGGGSPA